MSTRTAPRSSPVLVAAGALGIAVGVATSLLQGVLPDPVAFLANSGAVWSLVAFAAVAAVAARRWTPAVAVLGGTLVLVAEVLGYYAVASPLRGIATSETERVLWVGAALVLGPVLGLAGHRARSAEPVRRATACGAVAGLVAGEALHAMVRLGHPVQAWVELTIAVMLVWWGTRSPRAVVPALLSAAGAATVVYAVYGVA